MKKSLTQTKKELYYYEKGVKKIYKDGDASGLFGDVSGLFGNAGMAEIIIAKNRHGATFTSIIGFEAANVRFYDLERNEPSALQPNHDFNRQSETKDPF